MEESKTWVEALISKKLYPNLPGSTIRLWGFDFKIYPGKSLCIKMPNAFVKNEVKAGRIKVMDQPPPGVVDVFTPDQKKTSISLDSDKAQQFTMDAGTYYGAGDLDTLIEKLEEISSVPKIKAFARKRFDVSFPNNAKRDEILKQIRTFVELEIVKSKDE